MTGQEIVEIFPESPTEFFLKIVNAQLTFIDIDEGEKSQVILHQHEINRILKKLTDKQILVCFHPIKAQINNNLQAERIVT